MGVRIRGHRSTGNPGGLPRALLAGQRRDPRLRPRPPARGARRSPTSCSTGAGGRRGRPARPGRRLARPAGRDREQRGVLAVRVPPGPRAGRGRAARARRGRRCRRRRRRSGRADRTAVLVAQLERGTIGDAPTLERLLRDDVLGPEHRRGRRAGRGPAEAAADVLADAAVGHWAAGVLPPLVRRELTGALRRGAGPPCPARADLGPAAPTLAELLDAAPRPRRGRPRRVAGRRRRGPGRPPPLGGGDARGLVGRARLRPHPRPGDRAAARRPGLPRRRASPAATAPPACGTPSPAASRAWPWPTCSTRPRSRVLPRPPGPASPAR